MKLFVKPLGLDVSIFRGTPGSVGYDLFAYENVTIPEGCRAIVRTGLCMAIPRGYYGRIAPRSSMSLKGIDIGAGVIDPDYRGEIKVLLINNGNFLKVRKGDKIAQIIIEKCITPEIEYVSDLDNTQRGEGGFGSTDVHPNVTCGKYADNRLPGFVYASTPYTDVKPNVEEVD